MLLTNRQLFLEHVALPSSGDHAIEVVKAKGIYLYDNEGKRYVDLVSGVSVSNLGHGHPMVVEAVKEQAEKYMHLMVYGKYIQSPQVKLATKLAENLPANLQSVFFVNSGSEAIEGALKLARRVTGRSELISCKNAYHGSTMGALSVLGNEEMKYAYRPLIPDISQIGFNSFDDLERITNKTAAVLIEPFQAEAGILIPDVEFMTALRARCDQTGALLIFDEVQMGFGRTGKLFGFEHFNIVPDIICLAKAMGGGMPVGAFISSKENMNTLTHHPDLGHITTFGGHPVCCAAALASLNVILDENLHQKANLKGELFVKIISPHASVKQIRQKGLMLGVELKPEFNVTLLIDLFFQEGIVVDQFLFNDSSFRIAPPLTITDEEINEVSVTILKCLDKLQSTPSF
jgi:acetylornithine/succinyldiaminopimelate/putrescine aminotransferase